MQNINQRVEQLREWMRSHHIEAYIFPSADDHNSEYVANHFKTREWISGFDGSAGTAVVTLNYAALWTDSRYWLSAEEQLSNTPFTLMKEGNDTTPSIGAWINSVCTVPDSIIGIDGNVCSCLLKTAIETELNISNSKHKLVGSFDAANDLWKDRPELPNDPIEVQLEQYAGETVESKLQRIANATPKGFDHVFVSALDDIAWTLNLRGNDVEFNPVFYAWLMVNTTCLSGILYVNPQKITDKVKKHLLSANIEIRPYNNIVKDLASMDCQHCLLPNDVNIRLAEAGHQPFTLGDNQISLFKAQKNPIEQDGFRKAMLYDGVALVKFLRWLKPAVATGHESEISIDQKLTALRAENKHFCGLSFATIAAYNAHGAIVHYEANDETNAPLEPQGIILIDSGAQYVEGTTDITRTISLGEVTNEMRRINTLVLKGHIALTRCQFPKGTTGLNIDLAARYAMWREGMDFGHGTGHGVGSRLCVHEGPQQIRKNLRACTLQPLLEGMTITNEPGLYLAGRFGVRIENMLLVQKKQKTEFGTFYEFETLTLCPYDKQLIDLTMLNKEEIAWIDCYHQLVEEKLSPLLSEDDDKDWLHEQCKSIVGN